MDRVMGLDGAVFQSTPPARGATQACALGCKLFMYYDTGFNPRPPRGERPHVSGLRHDNIPIRVSIHAPREGSDFARPY